MTRRDSISRATIRTGLKLGGVLSLAATIAFAQNALDNSLHLGSGGINNTVVNQSPSRPRIRRDNSELREYAERTGYHADSDFYRNYAQDSRANDYNRNPQARNDRYPVEDSFSDRDNWKKKADPLRFDSQGLALTSASTRAQQDIGTQMAMYRTRGGETGTLTASNLRGVKLESDKERLGSQRMTLYETARLREDVRNNTMRADAIGVGRSDPFRPYQATDAIGAMKTPQARPKNETQGGEPLDTRSRGYDAVVREVKGRLEVKLKGDEKKPHPTPDQATPKEDESSSDRLVSAYDALRGKITEKRKEDDKKVKEEAARNAMLRPSADAAKGETTPASAADADKAKQAADELTLEDYAAILKHGQRIDTMTGEEKNRLNELLSEGQRAMYEGNSFVAETRFEVALAIRPNDPLALTGLLHCQIGANLAGSAALTLHKLYAQHPEMMDVKWGPQTLPPRARLEKALAEAGRRVTLGRDVDQYGLLQAYIGHLLGDQDAVTSGLNAMRGTPGDENMAKILRKLWVDPATDRTPQRINPAPEPKAADPAVPAVPAPAPASAPSADPAPPPTTTP
ncbi:MAG: hypothetical protein K8R92_07960 [Planctomycetes bacterium]|nr:hypothetical protein [Planctomycetota bacterium]